MAKTYNSFTLHSPPAQWQPGDLPHSSGTRALPPAPHRDSNPHPSSRPAPRPPAHRTRDGVVGGQQAARMAKAKSCADQVIADWYDDGRVGKIYPLHCYTRGDREASAGRPRLLEREGRDRPRARVREAGQARPGRQRPVAGLDGDDRPTTSTTTHEHHEDDDHEDDLDADDDRSTPTRPRRSCLRRTPPGRPRCRCRCSSSVASRCCSSRPAPPATSAAG